MTTKHATRKRRNGVNDPGILKAVFLAGGPGSGKSTVGSALFSFPRGKVTSAAGLKSINSDPYFERYLRAAGVDPKRLGTMAPAEFERHTEGPQSARVRGKVIGEKRAAHWVNGRLGVMVDGTGESIAKIARQRSEFAALGYDTYLVFVNTSLETAQRRNRARDRALPDSLVKAVWTEVQKNLRGFRELFGPNMSVVENDADSYNLPRAVEAAAARFVRAPIANPIGRAWIASERARITGGTRVAANPKSAKVYATRSWQHGSDPAGFYINIVASACKKGRYGLWGTHGWGRGGPGYPTMQAAMDAADVIMQRTKPAGPWTIYGEKGRPPFKLNSASKPRRRRSVDSEARMMAGMAFGTRGLADYDGYDASGPGDCGHHCDEDCPRCGPRRRRGPSRARTPKRK